MKTVTSIEPLECRIAPAALSGTILTYTDADGDAVTVTFKTKATLTEGVFTFDSAFGNAGPQQLRIIDLTGDPKFAKSSLAVTVVQAGGGDGEAAIGYINATGIDLKNVIIPGDLGRVDAGDAKLNSPGVKLLNVAALGEDGLATQGGAGSLVSNVAGSLTKLFVTRGITDANVIVGKDIKQLSVGGAIQGGAEPDSGSIRATGNISKATVDGGLMGGTGDRSGSIFSLGKIGSVTIGVGLIGSDGAMSGGLFSDGPMSSVTINGDVRGGLGSESGQIDSESKVSKIFIGGDIVGGAGPDSGGIDTEGVATKVTIMGSIIGGGSIESGLVELDGGAKNIFIGGSIIGGDGDESGIEITGKLSKLTIVGDVIGGSGELSGSVHVAPGTKPGKLGTASIGGDLRGGAGLASGLVTGESGIGKVSVTGDVVGGGGVSAGQIFSPFAVKQVAVGGAVTGGDGMHSGYIGAGGKLGTVKVGALLGGMGEQSGAIFGGGGIAKVIVQGSIESGTGILSGYIDSNAKLGLLMVGQNITGTATNRAFVTAVDGIGKIDVRGSVMFADFLAGYNDFAPVNPNVAIGKVSIGMDLIATNIVAGVEDTNANGFGNADDAAITGGTSKKSQIKSVSVGGTINGTAGADPEFGITAQLVKRVKIAGVAVALTSGAGNDQLVAITGVTTGDYRINEVA
ncbi:MAG: hypothetical protein ABMA13_16255 [Chthoniobacteraceae bacterium]